MSGPLPALPQLPPPPPPPGGTGSPPGGQETPLGEAPAPRVPSLPGGRLAPLTRAFQAKRRQQQRQVAQAPRVQVVQRAASESAEAREERRQQLETTRALLQQFNKQVAMTGVAPTPQLPAQNQQQAAAGTVLHNIPGRLASRNPRRPVATNAPNAPTAVPTVQQVASATPGGIRVQAAGLAAKRAAQPRQAPVTTPLPIDPDILRAERAKRQAPLVRTDLGEGEVSP